METGAEEAKAGKVKVCYNCAKGIIPEGHCAEKCVLNVGYNKW